METTPDIEQLQESLKKYINTRYELAVLKASDKVAVISSITVSSVIVAVMMLMFILFVSVAGSLYLGSVLQSNALGFLIVAGFYLFIGIIVLMFKEKLVMKPVRDRIIKAMFDGQ
ncbi:MAG: phage holin family protein [Bacteroidetes bacterium]|nr:phage holin family protein [Bacteroidota bacterium]